MIVNSNYLIPQKIKTCSMLMSYIEASTKLKRTAFIRESKA